MKRQDGNQHDHRHLKQAGQRVAADQPAQKGRGMGRGGEDALEDEALPVRRHHPGHPRETRLHHRHGQDPRQQKVKEAHLDPSGHAGGLQSQRLRSAGQPEIRLCHEPFQDHQRHLGVGHPGLVEERADGGSG